MEAFFAIIVGGLFASSVFLMLRRSLVKLLLGLMIFSQALNLLVFTSAGLTRGHAPIIPPGHTSVPEPHADPLPQALILTAIVISFGILTFTLALFLQTHKALQMEDLDQLKEKTP